MRPPRALAARGALLGASGGVAAGLVDFALAGARATAFLPVGRWKLAAFLCALYGAAGAAALAVVGLVLGAVLWASDGGALWRAAFKDEASDGARWVAYAVAAVASLALVGVALEPIALFTLHYFHHRALIAAVIGAAAAGLALPAALTALLAASALSMVLRVGPRARLHYHAPAGIEAATWILGLYVAAGAVGAMVFRLEERPRMPLPLKALNVALWAPVILAACLAIAHAIGRRLPLRDRALKTPRGALVSVATAVAAPLAFVLVAEWQLVRQLDLRPFTAVAVTLAAVVALLWADLGAPLRKQPLWLRGAIAVALPALLLFVALGVGRSDRVRKAAIAFTGATGPLVQLIHAATDLDHDGYSSVLGGGDCDDLDPDVHPGAFDFPDDGVDQDCNGHQATATPPPRAPWAAVPPSVPKDLNVVVITIDALRADHLGTYGYKRNTTPRIDAFAKEAVVFEEGWAHAPSTRYSIPAIQTGRYPSSIAQSAALHWPPQILPENRLFAEMLKDRGYHTGMTASYGGSGYFEPGWGMFQGFDEADTHLKSLHSLNGNPSSTHGTSSRQLGDLDVDWISKHKDQKFYFWTHFYDTHFDFERHPDMPESNFGDSEMDLYDGEIRFTDFHIGRVLDAIKAAGLWDKTIIVITADHGDGFGEHGIPPDKRHGYHLYATETKVPLIIRIPGVAPRRLITPAGHIDIIPTVLNALGAHAADEPTLQGTSRLGLMAGSAPDDGRGMIFQEVTYEGPGSMYSGTQKRAVVTREWHLLRNVVPDGTQELYHRSVDPDEDHDVSDTGVPAEAELSAALAAWMDEIALPPDFAQKTAGNVQPKPFAPAHALGDVLGDLVVVDGSDAPTTPVKRGGSLDVALYLHAKEKIPAGWRLFTHVVAPGRMLNADHDPVSGTMPLQHLRPGTFVRDIVHLTLPPNWPAGATTVRVGLWRGRDRAKATGAHAAADNAVDAATFVVAP